MASGGASTTSPSVSHELPEEVITCLQNARFVSAVHIESLNHFDPKSCVTRLSQFVGFPSQCCRTMYPSDRLQYALHDIY